MRERHKYKWTGPYYFIIHSPHLLAEAETKGKARGEAACIHDADGGNVESSYPFINNHF
jgi:hypothetical protein